MRLVGVDGCRAGWVAASSDVVDMGMTSLSDPTIWIAPSFQVLLDTLEGQRVLVGVDMPIGLPRGVPDDDGRRRADAEARRFLGPRRAASVFSAPCRPVLAAESYREACDLEVRARGSGRGLSQQTYRILPKIREVDRVISTAHQAPIDDAVRTWIREVHPEVTFAMLAGAGQHGYGLAHPKRGCAACRPTPCPDAAVRLDLLRHYVPTFDPAAEHARLLREFRAQPRCAETYTARGTPVAPDDVMDAVACLVTTLRIVSGQARTLTEQGIQLDGRGLRMEIVA